MNDFYVYILLDPRKSIWSNSNIKNKYSYGICRRHKNWKIFKVYKKEEYQILNSNN